MPNEKEKSPAEEETVSVKVSDLKNLTKRLEILEGRNEGKLPYAAKTTQHFATVRVLDDKVVIGIIEQPNGDKVYTVGDIDKIKLVLKDLQSEKTEEKVFDYLSFLNSRSSEKVKILKIDKKKDVRQPNSGAQDVERTSIDDKYNIKSGELVPLEVISYENTYTVEFIDGKRKGTILTINSDYLNL